VAQVRRPIHASVLRTDLGTRITCPSLTSAAWACNTSTPTSRGSGATIKLPIACCGSSNWIADSQHRWILAHYAGCYNNRPMRGGTAPEQTCVGRGDRPLAGGKQPAPPLADQGAHAARRDGDAFAERGLDASRCVLEPGRDAL
jgi:hypothetical protein